MPPPDRNRNVLKRTTPEPHIEEILTLLGSVSDKYEPNAREIKQWMTQNIPNPVTAALLRDTTVTMLQVVSAIGRAEPVNGITISKQTRIPKGSVSKITRRLIEQNLIAGESLPHDKKQVLFRLTPLGQELYAAHNAFDQQMVKGFIRFLNRYTPAELAFIIRLLQDLQATSFLDSPSIRKSPPRSKRAT